MTSASRALRIAVGLTLLAAGGAALASAAAPGTAGSAGTAGTAAARAAPSGSVPDLRAIAERIAAENLPVKEGQIVLVLGELHAIDFLEELSVAVARHGGSPLQVVTREGMALRLYKEVPQQFDQRRYAALVELADRVDAIVEVESDPDSHRLDGIPAARLATAKKATTEVNNILRDRAVPHLVIGNGLYPTPESARAHGLSLAELTRVFWAALAVPPKELRQVGDAVKGAVARGKQVRVTDPNGTDLTLSVDGRPVVVSDGTAAMENLNESVVETHLPAGEVLVAPVRNSANGTLVVERMPFEGGWLERLHFQFKQGRVVQMSGKPGRAWDRFRQLYDQAPQVGRDELALLDLGVNRGARAPRGRTLHSSIPAGAVTIGLGNNTRGGGETDIPFSFLAPLVGATVTVDGNAVVRDGELLVGGAGEASAKAAR